jgi:hypothetical protein
VSGECTCGRPRATAADLERWRAEPTTKLTIRPGRQVQIPASAAHALTTTPSWANALCWTRAGERCNMRRRWASDTHIGVARSVFALYQLGVVIR